MLERVQLSKKEVSANDSKQLDSKSNDTVQPVIRFNLPKPLNYNQFTFCCSLGTGSYGYVEHGKYTYKEITGIHCMQKSCDVAVKTFFEKVGHDIAKDCKNESAFHESLNHPNIIQCYGSCLEKPAIFLEYMPWGSLEKVLDENQLSWENNAALLLKLMLDIACALEYLHGQGKVHRDIKVGNILLKSLKGPAKLADFGLSGDEKEKRFAGTTTMLAPEVARTGITSKRSDIYSFGMTLLELLIGYPWINRIIYSGCNSQSRDELERQAQRGLASGKVAKQITDILVKYEVNKDPLISATAKLIKECTDENPEKRPTASDIVSYLRVVFEQSSPKAVNQSSLNKFFQPKPAPAPTNDQQQQATLGKTA